MKTFKLSKKPLIWFHYVLLMAFIVFAYFQTVWFGIMNLLNTNLVLGWFLLIVVYYINISIGDQLIHWVLGVD